MDQATMEKIVRAGKVTPAEGLAHAPLDRLDDAMTFLKRYRDPKEVCKAVRERIAKAPLDDFEALKNIYFKHCAG